MLGSGVPREIHHHLPVLLEDLPTSLDRISWCKDPPGCYRLKDVTHVDQARSSKLTHLVHATINVLGVLGRRESMTEIVRRLAVGEYIHSAVDLQRYQHLLGGTAPGVLPWCSSLPHHWHCPAPPPAAAKATLDMSVTLMPASMASASTECPPQSSGLTETRLGVGMGLACSSSITLRQLRMTVNGSCHVPALFNSTLIRLPLSRRLAGIKSTR